MERIKIHGNNNTIMLNLLIWNGYDISGQMANIQNNKVVRTIIGESKPMYISNGLYNENKIFFDS